MLDGFRKYPWKLSAVSTISAICLSISQISISEANANTASEIGYLISSSSEKLETKGRSFIAVSNSALYVKNIYTNSTAKSFGKSFKTYGFNWSPDGNQIIFTQSPGFSLDSEIYVMDLDGANPRRLTNNSVEERDPVWSHDGSKIAFGRIVQNGVSQIFVMNSDGSSPIQLTNIGEEGAFLPAWSPDGNQIAFVGSVGGVGQVFTMNSDGSNLIQITGQDNTFSFSPRWSPDGKKLVFSTYDFNENGLFASIFISNADGSSKTRVTQILSGVIAVDPSWSKDGNKILFVNYNYSQSTSDIFVINSDGTGMTKVVSQPNNSKSRTFLVSPRWRP